MEKKVLEIEKMQEFYRLFVQEREWDFFHNPKNLSMALSVEAAELLEIFQWLSEKQSIAIHKNPKKFTAIQEEMADILAYLIRLADVLDIDLEKAFWEKFKKNREKYPADSTRENSKTMKEKVLENIP